MQGIESVDQTALERFHSFGTKSSQQNVGMITSEWIRSTTCKNLSFKNSLPHIRPHQPTEQLHLRRIARVLNIRGKLIRIQKVGLDSGGERLCRAIIRMSQPIARISEIIGVVEQFRVLADNTETVNLIPLLPFRRIQVVLINSMPHFVGHTELELIY